MLVKITTMEWTSVHTNRVQFPPVADRLSDKYNLFAPSKLQDITALDLLIVVSCRPALMLSISGRHMYHPKVLRFE